MSNKKPRKVLYVMYVIFLVFIVISSTSSPSKASDQVDNEADVLYENTKVRGRFCESIDIVHVSSYGSWVEITCNAPLDLAASGLTLRYLIMFSDDSNPTDWEAAFILTSYGNNTIDVSWKIGKVTFEEAIGPNNWNRFYDESHFTIVDNTVTLIFIEYPATGYADIAVWTECVDIRSRDNPDIFHDWAPNTFEEFSFTASEEIIIADSDKDSNDSSKTEEPTSVPGFELIIVFVALSLVVTLMRQKGRS